MENDVHPRTYPPRLALSPPGPSTAPDTSPPLTRDSSPSPSISPTPGLYACPPLGRSFSANSFSDYSSSAASTISLPSVISRSSSASAAQRQRGYVRPQGVAFAPSAGNRDSVLSLGSIAHLQYYFARTGLLDGKGAQLAKDDRGKPGVGRMPSRATTKIRTLSNGSMDQPDHSEAAFDNTDQQDEPVMLPPTVSTYSHRTVFVPPPPDPESLRRELVHALKDARHALKHASIEPQNNESCGPQSTVGHVGSHEAVDDPTRLSCQDETTFKENGWHEIQGLHILDMVTLAIKAAKNFYTSHEKPQRLYSIKSERQIREELLSTMEVLKKLAGRQFVGGIRREEIDTMMTWINGIEDLLAKDDELERKEVERRISWTWLHGSWQDREREREWGFINSFHSGDPLPPWDPIDRSDPKTTPFLDFLRTGLVLVHLHNSLLAMSKRQFGEIRTFHTDLAKPYRCAENLRYWIKAAEIRWEVKLQINVSGVVNCKAEAYPDFDAALLKWCQAVRGELSREWEEGPRKAHLPLTIHE